MKIYFKIDAIPELAGILAPERRIVLHDCQRHLWRRKKMWAGVLLGVLLGIGAAAALLAGLLHVLPTELWVFFLCGFVSGALGMGVAWWVAEVFRVNLLRPFLDAELEKRRLAQAQAQNEANTE